MATSTAHKARLIVTKVLYYAHRGLRRTPERHTFALETQVNMAHANANITSQVSVEWVFVDFFLTAASLTPPPLPSSGTPAASPAVSACSVGHHAAQLRSGCLHPSLRVSRAAGTEMHGTARGCTGLHGLLGRCSVLHALCSVLHLNARPVLASARPVLDSARAVRGLCSDLHAKARISFNRGR